MQFFQKSKFLCLLCFVVLTGCETFKQRSCPYASLRHRAVMGTFPDDMTARPFDKKIVLVGGGFDLVHYGHLEFLEVAKRQGDYLVVALEPDAFIKHYKQRKPVHTQAQRAHILAHLDMVDEIVFLPVMRGYKDYLKLVEDIRPDVIAVTQGDPYLVQKKKQAKKIGAKVIIVAPRHTLFSTRNILKHQCP